tara:strand:+ start:141 stop:971 length:831 start_codon:yes stop_codon:yes gene_type:complete
MNDLLNKSILKLKNKNIPNPELDLKLLLQEASFSKKEIILSNLKIEDINLKYFDTLISKRLNRKPISKIIKKKYFWKSAFYVNSYVLDPRPETELIIEEVLYNIKDKNQKLKILDIGTGSGCIAISLASEFKNSKITAIDISKNAIAVAKKNVKLHNLTNQITIKRLRLGNLTQKFDIIISNPPYINQKEYKKLQPEVKKFEPRVALFGGKDGLKFYRLFAKEIEKIMKKKSIFICEIGHNQLSSCKKIFNNSNLSLKKISKDINNIDRTLTFFKI